MSICELSGNSLGIILQQKSRLSNALSKKILLFGSTLIPNLYLDDIVTAIYKLYIEKTMFFYSSENIHEEELIKHQFQYCNEIIEELFLFHKKSGKSENTLPFKDMGLVLRTIQSFLLSKTISNSLLKLYKEYNEERLCPNIQNFDSSLFLSCIKSGNLEDAIKLIKKHPQNKSSLINHLETCLNPASRVFGLLYHNENEFLQHFEAISLESQKVIKLCDNDPELKKIAKIIGGNIESFMALNPTWLEYLIYHCLFIEGVVYDPESLAQTLLEKFSDLYDIDHILIEIIFGNLHSVIQKLSLFYPSFFISHVVDILATIGKLPSDPQNEFEGLNYPEYYFFNYINEIICITSLPVCIPCDYIYHNLGGLPNTFEMLNQAALIRIPNGNISEMVNYFNKHNLNEISQNIHKIKAMECLQKNDINDSLY